MAPMATHSFVGRKSNPSKYIPFTAECSVRQRTQDRLVRQRIARCAWMAIIEATIDNGPRGPPLSRRTAMLNEVVFDAQDAGHGSRSFRQLQPSGGLGHALAAHSQRVGDQLLDHGRIRREPCLDYSHSMVAGGLPQMS